MAASGAQNKLLLLLLLLGAAGGVGFWNYQRNTAAENSEPRPFRGYATADLDRMIVAQKAEISRMQPLAERARHTHAEGRNNGFIAEQIREFERVHRESTREREISGQLSDLEVMEQQLEKERALRNGEGGGELLRVLRLSFTF
jgi:hypothetical protein